jgi:hypothetical protein
LEELLMTSRYEVNRRRKAIVMRVVLWLLVVATVAAALAGIWLASGQWAATAGVLGLTAFFLLPVLAA